MEAEQNLIPGLPKDVGLTCVAVSNNFPKLALLNKAFGNLIMKENKILFGIRKLEGMCDTWFYIDGMKSQWQNYIWEKLNVETKMFVPMPILTDGNFNQSVKIDEDLIRIYGNKICRYNVSSDEWNEVYKDLPLISQEFVLASDADSIIIAGGLHDHEISSKVWIYDCKSNQLDALPDMITGKSQGGAIIFRGELWYVGGRTFDFHHTSAQVYNMQQKKWREIFDMWPIHIQSVKLAVLDDKMYGIDDGGSMLTTYDAVNNIWEPVCQLPVTIRYYWLLKGVLALQACGNFLLHQVGRAERKTEGKGRFNIWVYVYKWSPTSGWKLLREKKKKD